MRNESKPVTIKLPPPRRGGFWRRLPAAVKIALAVPLVMALLGAEIELRLSPQIDVIATAAGICAIWAWFSGGPSAMV